MSGCHGSLAETADNVSGVSDERPIRVLLVDDHELVVEGLRLVINGGAKGRIEVVGTALDGLAAIDAVHAVGPDVILMDIDMPRLDGIEATRRIRQLPDPPGVIILTALEPGDQASRAGGAGASGFLLKGDDLDRILSGIVDVAHGNGALSPRITEQMLRTVGRAYSDDDLREAVELYSRLTGREVNVADLIGAGKTNKEIAKTLFLSESTIKTHLSSIQQKFSADNRVIVAVMVTKARFGLSLKAPKT